MKLTKNDFIPIKIPGREIYISKRNILAFERYEKEENDPVPRVKITLNLTNDPIIIDISCHKFIELLGE